MSVPYRWISVIDTFLTTSVKQGPGEVHFYFRFQGNERGKHSQNVTKGLKSQGNGNILTLGLDLRFVIVKSGDRSYAG